MERERERVKCVPRVHPTFRSLSLVSLLLDEDSLVSASSGLYIYFCVFQPLGSLFAAFSDTGIVVVYDF